MYQGSFYTAMRVIKVWSGDKTKWNIVELESFNYGSI